jgi:hypothetical protein
MSTQNFKSIQPAILELENRQEQATTSSFGVTFAEKGSERNGLYSHDGDVNTISQFKCVSDIFGSCDE